MACSLDFVKSTVHKIDRLQKSLSHRVQGIITGMLSKRKLLQVLALEIVLFAPGFFSVQTSDKPVKGLEQYWAETDLKGNELDDLLQPSTCSHDSMSYLACANAVTQVAEKYGFEVEPNGNIHTLERADVAVRWTERQALQIWKKAFQDHPNSPQFSEIWKKLQSKINRKDQQAFQVALGMNAYLSLARDPHSYIIPIAYYEEVIAKSDSKTMNLGFVIRRTGETAVVRKIFEGSPAATAGLQKGDEVLEINGRSLQEMLPNAFAEALRNSQGPSLNLKVRHWNHNQKSEREIHIVRTDFVSPSVTSQVLEGQRNSKSYRLGLLVLNKFAHQTCDIAKNELNSLKEQGIEGLLVDLRDNPGGQVEEAACFINLFIKRNKLMFETRYLDRGRSSDRYFSEDDPVYMGPLAVLTNSGSASASEIVAGSLKDLGRATLVGERTFGKGSFQDGRMWESHTKVAVFETQGLYYFPSGWTPQVVGIEPDIAVDFNIVSQHRESELFFNPIVPKDMWTGPQSLTWLQMMSCQGNDVMWQDFGSHFGDDTQLMKAKEWLFCQRQARLGL